MLFGMRVRRLRMAKGYTQFDLATLMNADVREVRRIERGEGKIGISIVNIEKIALALDVSLKELFDFEQEMKVTGSTIPKQEGENRIRTEG